MAGLPRGWRFRGGDPFREAKSLAGVKVTTPEAFLQVRNAASLEEIQSILTELPPETVLAGLDGEPLLRYVSPAERCSNTEAEHLALSLLAQAHAQSRIDNLHVEENIIGIKFRSPQVDNEKFSYLKWHLARVTGRTIVFDEPPKTRRKSSPRTFLKSMLPRACRIDSFEADIKGNAVTASIVGLTPEERADISEDFRLEYGMDLHLRGQMSLF